MIDRVILIVDDNPNIERVYFPNYKKWIQIFKNNNIKWKDYSFQFIHIINMDEALEYMQSTTNIVDVLVVDYNFNNTSQFETGAAFIKFVREKINRYCQIIFYTMQSTTTFSINELVDLINSDVYKMIDKSIVGDNSLIEAIFNAATERNPFIESLESFFIKYDKLLESSRYSVMGESITFSQLINHIRMDDKEGRILLEKLLQKAILSSIDIEVI